MPWEVICSGSSTEERASTKLSIVIPVVSIVDPESIPVAETAPWGKPRSIGKTVCATCSTWALPAHKSRMNRKASSLVIVSSFGQYRRARRAPRPSTYLKKIALRRTRCSASECSDVVSTNASRTRAYCCLSIRRLSSTSTAWKHARAVRRSKAQNWDATAMKRSSVITSSGRARCKNSASDMERFESRFGPSSFALRVSFLLMDEGEGGTGSNGRKAFSGPRGP
mmetsp:Transcript_114005/g.221433  ORF Transcript_114005/g.221433 Transcript_114005/m.221433 type:complete len:225 (-) Transcript_114005:37-711(-)